MTELPPRRTSRGLRPADASPSATQPECSCVDPWPGAPPNPPSEFCAFVRYDSARALEDAAEATGGWIKDAATTRATTAASTAGTVLGAVSHETSNRRR